MTEPARPVIAVDPVIPVDNDPHLWLEDVTGDEQLAWVTQRNEQAEAELQDARFPALKQDLQTILEATDRIPAVVLRGDHLYNLWTDAQHPQGIWRRTSMESYLAESTEWEVLLDLDALSAQEETTWVWHGADLLRPAADESYARALVSLSPGGSDADVTREFNLLTGEFIDPEQGGFYKPEGKGGLSWIDENTVALTHDIGPENVTTSGYPRVAYRWSRGTALEQAQPVHSVGPDDLVAGFGYSDTPGFERYVAVKARGFFSHETYLVDPEGDGEAALTRIPVPDDVRVGFHRDLALLTPRTDFDHGGTRYPAGSLIVADADALAAGGTELAVLFAPTESASLQGVSATLNTLVVTVMEDVQYKVLAFWREAGQWRSAEVFSGISGTLSVAALDDEEGDKVWLSAQDFLNPTELMLADLAPVLNDEPETVVTAKSTPRRFETAGLISVQRFAVSADGTRIPYFLVGPEETITAEGKTVTPRPTLLSGYGGFQISRTPGYQAVTGKAWLEQGGVYAVANIRGGGEYGPQWHHAALKENRHRAYEDFAAVAEDLVSTGVTTVPQLACQGGSNGGLLTGNMLTQYPHLFGAVVIMVPLLDMRRFHQLLAGASWRAEYGDPDAEDWEFMKGFSAYHLLDGQQSYPPVLLTTSTRDDRVHPGHARKMTAALESIGADVRYWENTEGGHGGAANPAQQAQMNALVYRFLWQQLGR